MDMDHLDFLKEVTEYDLSTLRHKEATYEGSWKKRGGTGAFMMAARKWDRLENIAKKRGFDIFAALEEDMSGADGSALAEVRDLRQYLLLIEAEMLARKSQGMVKPFPEQFRSGTPEDGGHHARQEDGGKH